MAQTARALDLAHGAAVLGQAAALRPLDRRELPIDTVELARSLIGKTLVRDLRGVQLSGRIVETEAYPVGDAAGHAFRGETRANRALFLERGRAYVYFIYGSCWCVNVTSEIEGVGGGVLLRALEPLSGVAQMKRNRRVTRELDVARGPGRLAQALRVTGTLDGVDLCNHAVALWLADAVRTAAHPGISTRIGLSREAHRKLRFYERGSAFVSGPAYLRK